MLHPVKDQKNLLAGGDLSPVACSGLVLHSHASTGPGEKCHNEHTAVLRLPVTPLHNEHTAVIRLPRRPLHNENTARRIIKQDTSHVFRIRSFQFNSTLTTSTHNNTALNFSSSGKHLVLIVNVILTLQFRVHARTTGEATAFG